MKKYTLVAILILFANLAAMAQVSVPHIFSDGMLFQRQQPIQVWGTAKAKEQVKLYFKGETKVTKADKNGDWLVEFSPSEHGGPYVLEIEGKSNKLSFQNILIGDLWLASGQSNMEMTIDGWAQVYNYEEEVQSANYPKIRTFNTEKSVSGTPQKDMQGKWLVCSPSTAADFSATAYFFARKLYKELDIPIGIIHSSWGGTEIETWISGEAYKKLPAEFWDKYSKLNIKDFDIFTKENEKKEVAYKKALANDKGIKEKWYGPNTYMDDWESFPIPKEWGGTVLDGIQGYVWFRYKMNLPEIEKDGAATISLGAIDDDETAWINDTEVGATKGYNVFRKYDIPAGVLHKGENIITVRVYNGSGEAGFTGTPEDLYLSMNGKKYPIAGEWRHKVSVTTSEYGFVNLTPYTLPSLLYNTMINPVTNMPVKGVIWYQGESNENNAYQYRTLFPTLINDWRTKWNNAEMPFYWVQLANYKAEDKNPQESKWAELREAQDMTLSLPNTGQAVITDVGDADDIHPRNKQDVGLRLALITLNKDYGKGNVYSGPRYQSHEIQGNKIIIKLDKMGSDIVLRNKYRYISGFSIAGADKKFAWAKAELQGDNTIVVYADSVANPVAVRYSWANNPDVDVFNSEDLPLVPFRTDIWKGITQK